MILRDISACPGSAFVLDHLCHGVRIAALEIEILSPSTAEARYDS